jgi:predicted HTH domain antitoxin
MGDAEDKKELPPRPVGTVAELLESWIQEDSRLEGGFETWKQLKRALDCSRPGGRPLFPLEHLMPRVTFDVPEGALSALRLSPAEFVKEMRVAAALLWYSEGAMSQSKAAEIAGTSRAEFIDALARWHISAVQVTREELLDEIDRD